MPEERKPYLPIEETEIFAIFERVADWAWNQVKSWKALQVDTVGSQLVRAVDSINANLVEGDGRFGDADGLRFFVIARASGREARLWIDRAMKRRFVPEQEALEQISALSEGLRQLNLLINYRRRSPKLQIKEELSLYAKGGQT